MKPLPVADRSFAGQLNRESEGWVADGIVSAEQAAAIRGRYARGGEEPRGRATVALAVIGAVAVGFGVIGFIAANWDGMSHAARLLLLTLAVAGSYGAAFHLRERTGSMPRVGEALYLVGVLLFGASLFLVGQMYNVEAHDPLALLLWAGGATATALVVRSHAIAATAVLIFTGWVGFEFGLALDDAGETFSAFPVVALLYGGALYGLATAAQERFREHRFAGSGFPESGRGVGLPVAAAGLFVFTFAAATDGLERAGDELGGLLLAAFLFLAALALSGAAALARSRRPSGRYESGVLAVVVVAVLVAVLAGGDGDLYAILFNVVFAAVALGVIYAGYLSDEPWLVNLGVVLVAVDLVARYFDVFWDALPRSVGMIGAGLLVLGIAFLLERQRKRLLERMGE
ncbi:MAG: DUF2157 domain-containing protein [Gaiellaceae bacterium]